MTAELGRRVRKGLVAAGLLAGIDLASFLVRDPRFDGWVDAYTWPQLFLSGPLLFSFCITAWQLICIAGYLLLSVFKRKPPAGGVYDPKGAAFWIHDSSRILGLYAASCAIGDVPMLLSYAAAVRGWHFHWWWSDVAVTCLLLTAMTWWVLERSVYGRPNA